MLWGRRARRAFVPVPGEDHAVERRLQPFGVPACVHVCVRVRVCVHDLCVCASRCVMSRAAHSTAGCAAAACCGPVPYHGYYRGPVPYQGYVMRLIERMFKSPRTPSHLDLPHVRVVYAACCLWPVA